MILRRTVDIWPSSLAQLRSSPVTSIAVVIMVDAQAMVAIPVANQKFCRNFKDIHRFRTSVPRQLELVSRSEPQRRSDQRQHDGEWDDKRCDGVHCASDRWLIG